MSDFNRKLFDIVGTDDTLIINFIRDIKSNSENVQDFETKITKMDVGLSTVSIREIYNVLERGNRNTFDVKEWVSNFLKTSLGIEDQVIVNFLLDTVNKVDSKTAFYREMNKLDNRVPQSVLEKIYRTAKGGGEIVQKYEGLALSSIKTKCNDFTETRQPLPKRNPFLKHHDNPEPIRNRIYRGKVKNITSFGCFVHIYGIQGKNCHGLVHISEMANGKVNMPQDLVRMGQEVFVKIIKLQKNGNISLSLKNIDQYTGKELDSTENMRGRKYQRQEQSEPRGRTLTSPERWEIGQLIASGAVSAEDYPELNQSKINRALGTKEHKHQQEQVDVELNVEDEPSFLKGVTEKGLPEVEKTIKNVGPPKTSMSKAAANGSSLMKAHKEEKSRLKKEIEKRIRQRRELVDPAASREAHMEIEKLRRQLVLSEWEKSRINEKTTIKKTDTLPTRDRRKALPIYGMREELLQVIRDNQFIVIVGETGSGKTTQITQFLNESGFGEYGIIGCTQPRRVAAISVAQRVADEMGCKIGNEVGYTIRFEDKTSRNTSIKYMTDGMLQREALLDPKMSRYSVIMLDEAHERTVATDVLFALLKQAAIQRADLKVIVTSATLDSSKFSEYFHNCPVKYIPGKTYPVDVIYSMEPQMDYLESALECVMQIHINEEPGDILVFLTGQEEIDSCCEILYQRVKTLAESIDKLIIFPIYSALPGEIQSKIFERTPEKSRKVVFATNIAETSITIEGIRYVVDPGFAKINIFNSRSGMEQLVISPISQAQANQRKGRAGRTCPGKCFRLYTELSFHNDLLPHTIPEIQRQNLSHTILLLKAMGINDLLHFEFMDPPPKNLLIGALEELFNLEALADDGHLTELGSIMSQFPTEPTLSRTLLSSVTNNCSEEIIIIISMLSIPGIFYRPRDKQQEADNKKVRFHHPYGDHLTLLNIYQRWQLANFSEQFCTAHFLQYKNLRRARDVNNQLISIFRKLKLSIVSCGTDYDVIRKTLVSGFFMNAAKRDSKGGYNTIVGQIPIVIHPSSSLYGKEHEYVIYHSLLLTTREYMSQVTVINPEWLLEAAPHFYKVADETKKRAKITPMFQRSFQRPNAKRMRR